MALISNNPNNAVSPAGVLVIAFTFTFIVWMFIVARFWALRHNICWRFSPRCISNAAVILILVFVSISLLMVCYAYHIVHQIQDIQRVLENLEHQKSGPSVSRAELALVNAELGKIRLQLDRFILFTKKVEDPCRRYISTFLIYCSPPLHGGCVQQLPFGLLNFLLLWFM